MGRVVSVIRPPVCANFHLSNLYTLPQTQGNIDTFFLIKFFWSAVSPVALVVKDPACQRRGHKRHRFKPSVRKMPWRRK